MADLLGVITIVGFIAAVVATVPLRNWLDRREDDRLVFTQAHRMRARHAAARWHRS
jgi:hypothetical protein